MSVAKTRPSSGHPPPSGARTGALEGSGRRGWPGFTARKRRAGGHASCFLPPHRSRRRASFAHPPSQATRQTHDWVAQPIRLVVLVRARTVQCSATLTSLRQPMWTDTPANCSSSPTHLVRAPLGAPCVRLCRATCRCSRRRSSHRV